MSNLSERLKRHKLLEDALCERVANQFVSMELNPPEGIIAHEIEKDTPREIEVRIATLIEAEFKQRYDEELKLEDVPKIEVRTYSSVAPKPGEIKLTFWWTYDE